MEDIWGLDGDDQAEYDRRIAEREWEKLQENHGNEGYKDGIVEGKEVKMQQGFDQGYKEGLVIGKELGQLRGIVSTHLTFCKQSGIPAPELTTLYEELISVKFEHIYSKDYFTSDASPPDYVSPRAHVERWRRRVDEAVNKQLSI